MERQRERDGNKVSSVPDADGRAYAFGSRMDVFGQARDVIPHAFFAFPALECSPCRESKRLASLCVWSVLETDDKRCPSGGESVGSLSARDGRTVSCLEESVFDGETGLAVSCRGGKSASWLLEDASVPAPGGGRRVLCAEASVVSEHLGRLKHPMDLGATGLLTCRDTVEGGYPVSCPGRAPDPSVSRQTLRPTNRGSFPPAPATNRSPSHSTLGVCRPAVPRTRSSTSFRKSAARQSSSIRFDDGINRTDPYRMRSKAWWRRAYDGPFAQILTPEYKLKRRRNKCK